MAPLILITVLLLLSSHSDLVAGGYGSDSASTGGHQQPQAHYGPSQGQRPSESHGWGKDSEESRRPQQPLEPMHRFYSYAPSRNPTEDRNQQRPGDSGSGWGSDSGHHQPSSSSGGWGSTKDEHQQRPAPYPMSSSSGGWGSSKDRYPEPQPYPKPSPGGWGSSKGQRPEPQPYPKPSPGGWGSQPHPKPTPGGWGSSIGQRPEPQPYPKPSPGGWGSSKGQRPEPQPYPKPNPGGWGSSTGQRPEPQPSPGGWGSSKDESSQRPSYGREMWNWDAPGGSSSSGSSGWSSGGGASKWGSGSGSYPTSHKETSSGWGSDTDSGFPQPKPQYPPNTRPYLPPREPERPVGGGSGWGQSPGRHTGMMEATPWPEDYSMKMMMKAFGMYEGGNSGNRGKEQGHGWGSS